MRYQKELKNIFKILFRNGWSIVRNRHYKCTSPEGKVVIISSSASDNSFIYWVKRDLKKFGVLIENDRTKKH